MPIVPQYNARTVAPQGLPDTRFNPNTSGAFGEAIGAGLNDAANAAARIQAEDDSAAVKTAMSEARRHVNEMQFTGEGAYFTRKGEEAYTSLPTQMKSLEEEMRNFGEGLNPRQRERFSQISREYLDRENDQMSRYAMQERTRWRNEADEANILSSQEDGSLRWNNNDEYAGNIKHSISQISKRNGWSPEKRELKEREALSGMHVTAIDNIIEQSPDQAQAYFQENRADIVPSMHDDIARKIESRDTDLEAQTAADAAVALGSESEARKYVKEQIKDPDIRRAANTMIAQEFAAQRRDHVKRREDSYAFFDEQIRLGDTIPALKMHYYDEWNSLLPSQKAALTKGTALVTDPRAYFEAKGHISAGDPDAAWKVIEGGKISNTDSKRLIDQMSKPPRQLNTNVLSNKAAFDKAMPSIIGEAPRKSAKGREEHKAKYSILMGMYQERIDEWHQNNPGQKYIPAAERDKILDEFLIKSTREESFLGFDSLWPDKEVTLQDIPAEEMRKVEEALRVMGYPVTPENVVKLYMSEN